MLARLIRKISNIRYKNISKDIGNISRDDLLCREYIEYEGLNKKERPKESLIKTLSEGCKILEKLDVKYWIGRGSLLGFHRDNDFLPNDIDIDIDIYSDKDVYKIIQAIPYDALFVTNCRGRYMQLAFLDRETEVIFDVWFYYDKGKKLYNRNYFGYFWLPSDLLYKLEKFHFEDQDYPIPPPEWYCSFWYGENWKKPKGYGTDWTVEYRKDCKGFIYKGAKNITDLLYYKD